jgi:hypothetical protein
MGLLAAGLSMMATPPRQVPYSNTEILGNAGLTGVKYYEQALEAKRKDELMKQTAEEHTLAREDRRQANLDRAETNKFNAETRRLTGESLVESRAAKAALAKVETAAREEGDKEVDSDILDALGVPELAGITNREFKDKQQSIVARIKPPPVAVTTDKDGTVHVIPKTVGEYPGAGKPARPAAGSPGARPTTPQWQEQRATQSLKEQGIEAPTVKQIADERAKLFPRGTGKAPAASPRAALRGAAAAGEERVLNGKTYFKKDGQWYEK